MIHWIGAGLSSIPGVRRLATQRPDLGITLWNRTLSKAEEAVQDLDQENITAKKFDWNQFKGELKLGDVVISMLPATMHMQLAECCLAANAHFVSSSYISDEMRALDDQARQQDLCFVNEVGLDPGLDHLFAHELIYRYRDWLKESGDPEHKIEFHSYCGAFPAEANDFRYKFSWSPAGVLRALKSPATYVKQGGECTISTAWEDLTAHTVGNESFEGYPNRNSVPFITQYHLDDKREQISTFIRGTLRQEGWAEAWGDIFEIVKTADEATIQSVSDELYQKYAYAEGEPDRVVLYVQLKCVDKNDSSKVLWEDSLTLDEKGCATHSALAKLVSYPTSLAVEEVLSGVLPVGVSAVPSDRESVSRWFTRLREFGVEI